MGELLGAFVLRRMKSQVLTRLPPKAEVALFAPMSFTQLEMTKELLQQDSDLLVRMEQVLPALPNPWRRARATRCQACARPSSERLRAHCICAGQGSHMQGDWSMDENDTRSSFSQNDWRTANNLLAALRKCCNHPFLFDGLEQAAAAMSEGLTEASGKLRVLHRLLLRLLPRDHRVVIFAQNTSTLDILERFCTERRYTHVRLDGATNRVQRNLNISSFNASDRTKIFLCSTRAGGLGVTLTAADNVILFDSDFNPQVDRQAVDRVHRIGQTRPVTAWRLLCRGSVEERIAQRAANKLGLEAAVHGEEDATHLALTGATITRDDTIAMLRDAAYGAQGGGVEAYGRNHAPLTDSQIDALIVDAERVAQAQLIDAAAATRQASAALGHGGRGRGRGGGGGSGGDGRGYGRGYGRAAATPRFGYGNYGAVATAGQPAHGVPHDSGVGAGPSSLGADHERRKPGRPPGSGRGRGRPPGSGCGRGRGRSSLADLGHVGGGGLKRPSSVYEAIEHGQFVAGKRQVKQRTTLHEGSATLRINLDQDVPRPPKPDGRRRQQFENYHLCQSCWDGGELVMCDYCPVSLCFSCAGVTAADLGPSWRCGHHQCTSCGRRASAAGGMLFRCAECPNAFCEVRAQRIELLPSLPPSCQASPCHPRPYHAASPCPCKFPSAPWPILAGLPAPGGTCNQ